MSTPEQSVSIGRSADEAATEALSGSSGTIAISLSLSMGSYEQIDQELLGTVMQLAFQRVQSTLRNSDGCTVLNPHLLAVVLHAVEVSEVFSYPSG